jgi:adenine C2-methylase RlmN of 23S rRNA A2503 and tRNA A37
VLSSHHVAAFVRRTRGGDVAAACGQLAYLDRSDATGVDATARSSVST